MKIIGINGSPRKDGNSEILLKIALDSLPCETEQINLREYDIKRCLACGTCGKDKKTGKYQDCAMKGKDDVNMIYDKLLEADGFIIATPVYFGLPTPLLVDFMNRSRYLRHQDFKLLNKVFAVFAIAGRRSGGNETAIFATWLPFFRNGCIPVGNMDKSCQFGTVGWAGGKGDILLDEWGITQAKDTARRVLRLSTLIKAGERTYTALNKTPYKFDYMNGSIKKFIEDVQK